MRVQPVRFIGHKIGPFEHIELNWPTDKDIRSTIIIGENGAGKTTLVTSMAACLGNGNLNAFPQKEFDRLAYDENSSAFFEFLLDGTLMSSLVITHHI
ncbi:MAG: AAA family ATPase, partial [Chloroflexota bacterium]